MEDAALHEESVNAEDVQPNEVSEEVYEDSVPDASPSGDPPNEDPHNHDDAGRVVETTPPVSSSEDDVLCEIRNEISDISNGVSETAAAAKKTALEISEIHRLYHNEFACRLKSMQEELDEYHKADRGHAYDGILSALARIYGNNETLVDEISDPKVQKHVNYLLLDLLDLLEEYGVQRVKSCPGDKRNTRHSQVLERIPTSDEEKHDTVAKSRSSGFAMGNRTIIKEIIDVFLFDKGAAITPSEADSLASDTGTMETNPNNEI